MGRTVYKEGKYSIVKVGNGFIIHNSSKDFDDYHTHIKSLNMAKTLVACLIHKKLPKTRNPYLLTSLIRVTDDEEYADKVEQLKKTRSNKQKPPYRRAI